LDTIVEDIKRQNNFSDEQFLAELDREGIRIDELRESYALDLLKARLINQITREQVNLLTDNDVKNFYSDPKNKQFFTITASVQLSQIFIPVPEDISYKEAIEIKKRSEEIYNLAKNGQSFTELVKLHSMSPNKEENLGFLGSFTMKQLSSIMNQDGANAIFSLDEGDIAPPMRFNDGYYIFKVDEKNEQKLLSYEEAYENIKSYLLRLKGQELLKDKLLSMRQAINVKIMIETE
jgi:peptidyl-prolyl cis-trans isomerase SurA